MLFRLKYTVCFAIIAVIFLGFFSPLSSIGKKDMTYSFVPVDTNNVIAVNLKKFFQLFDYKDIYKLGFLHNKNSFFKGLSIIIKKAGIDPKNDLDYLLFTSTDIINDVDYEKIFSNTVLIIKASYNPDKLEKSIIEYFKNKRKLTKSKLKAKRILNLGSNMFGYSVVFHDKRTIMIGMSSSISKYMEIFKKNKNNIFSNKNFSSIFKIIKKKPILTFYITSSPFFKTLFEQKDESFKMDLKDVSNFEGSFDSDKMTFIGKIDIISNNKKANKLTENGLRKLLAMSAMSGEQYINIAEKININVVERGIRIFFTFDIE